MNLFVVCYIASWSIDKHYCMSYTSILECHWWFISSICLVVRPGSGVHGQVESVLDWLGVHSIDCCRPGRGSRCPESHQSGSRASQYTCEWRTPSEGRRTDFLAQLVTGDAGTFNFYSPTRWRNDLKNWLVCSCFFRQPQYLYERIRWLELKRWRIWTITLA